MNHPPFSEELHRTPPLIMNVDELAFVLGVSARTLRYMTADRTIPRIKIGRRVLYRWPQVEAALARLEAVAIFAGRGGRIHSGCRGFCVPGIRHQGQGSREQCHRDPKIRSR